MFDRARRITLRSRIADLMSRLEAVFIQAADSRGPWWPFGFLRPSPHQRLSSARVAVLSLLQGLPVALFLVLLDGTARRADAERSAVVFLLAVCIALFAVNRSTLAYFWNRRASYLAVHRARRDSWLNGED
jgi:hypothetical protein